MTYSLFLAFLTLTIVSVEPLSQMRHNSDLISRNKEVFQVKLHIQFPTRKFDMQLFGMVKTLLTKIAVTGPPAYHLFIPINFYLSSPEVSLYCPELKLDFLQRPMCRLQGL